MQNLYIPIAKLPKSSISCVAIFFMQDKKNISRAIEYIAIKQHTDNKAARRKKTPHISIDFG